MGQGIESMISRSGLSQSYTMQLGASFLCCGIVQLSRNWIDPIAFKYAPRLGAKTKDEQLKFSNQLVNFAFHAVAGGYLAKIVYGENWLHDAGRVWANYPDHEPNGLYVGLFCAQFGYHLQRLLQVAIQKRKKDFLEMALHHVVTVFLIGYSSWAGYVRIGLCVLMVHDLSDCLGCMCKILSSLNWSKCLVATFFPMQASWAYTRLYVLPCQIIPQCHLCPAGITNKGVLACIGSLWILVGLNAYWYTLFMKMLYRLATKGKADDLQEDKPEEKSVPMGE